jgi:hypothetical protein
MPTATDATPPPDVVERLYGGDLDEFVPARTAAAKALRGGGHRAEAAAVEALRKPTVAAAAVNRIVRAEPKLLDALLDGGERLREVQLAAGSAADLRAAVEAESSALDAIVRAAAKAGAGEATLAKVRETLHAAALDPALAAEVRAGALAKEAQAVGFPLGVAVPAQPARPQTQPAQSARADAAARKRRQKAEADAARATEGLTAAAADLDEARAALAAAERTLKGAQARERAARRAHAAATDRAEKAAAALAEAAG